MDNSANLVIGWRAAGQASGRNAASLANACSLGRLPFRPAKIGHRVALTQAQIEILRKGGDHDNG